jgi:HEAT repeat protein
MRQSIQSMAVAIALVGAASAQQSPPPGRPDPAADVRAAIEQSHIFDQAMTVLLASYMADDPFVRANVIEAMQQVPDRAKPLVKRGLGDVHPAPRFAAVVTAGMLNMTDLVPSIQPLLRDENASVRAAAIYALDRLGAKIDITPLAGMLTSGDPALRSNVAMILGLLGDASAIPMLQSAATVAMPRVSAARAAVVRMQIAEAIVKLGDDTELNALRAGAYNQFDEVRVLAITAMGAVADQRMVPALSKFLANEPAEVRMAAATAMARLGDGEGLGVLQEYLTHEQAVLRAQAAWGLGWFGKPGTMGLLVKLMSDPSQQVRVAAAGSVVRRLGRGAR